MDEQKEKYMSVLKRITIVVVLSCGLFGLKVSGQSFSYRDSVYRRIIMEGGKSIDCHLSYQIGSSRVLPSYGGNAVELGKLDDFLRVTLADTLVSIKGISITGYGSIEGTYIRNEELSRVRAEGFALYLKRRYSGLFSCPVRTAHVAEDWEGLKELVSASSLGEKELVLSIINYVGVFEGREKQLMELGGGGIYREMQRNYFPLLRRVQVRVEYDLQKVIEEHYQVKIEQKDFAAVLEREKERLGISTTKPAAKTDITVSLQDDAPAEREQKPALPPASLMPQSSQSSQSPELSHSPRSPELSQALQTSQSPESSQASPSPPRSPSGEFLPLLAVKTNLLYLGGYSAELKKEYLTPNVEVEYFPAPHWSISGEYVYGVVETQGDDAHVWAPSSLSLEPRYWFFDRSGKHHWLYLGIYGLYGEFDELYSDAQDDGHTGSYYEGGLSAGCYIPFGSRLGVELGARLGYRSTDGAIYYYSNSHYYYKSSYTQSGLKATGFRVSVSYRFGKKHSPRK
ncbi:MAG: Immunoreactive 53 kDa antigen [Bacteroidetes bacterium]|nr:Immunoreactive 53 kDa antigen [Bacteroidota bacterium]